MYAVLKCLANLLNKIYKKKKMYGNKSRCFLTDSFKIILRELN